MSCFVVAWLLGHLAAELRYLERVPSRCEIRSGDVRALVCTAPCASPASGGSHHRAYDDEQRLALWLMARVGSKGSDVRLSSGELCRPGHIKYMGTNVNWWQWETCFGCGWKEPAHINELEVRASLLDMQRRSRQKHNVGTRYISLLDSQVPLGVLTKKRSSSHLLNRVVRKCDALELASSMCPFYAFCRSADNPADAPSRKRRRKFY